MQCSFKRLMRQITLGIRPKEVCHPVFRHVYASQGNNCLEQFQWFTLNLSGKLGWCIFFYYGKTPQCKHLQWPRPVFAFQRWCVGNEMTSTDEMLDVRYFDSRFQRLHAQAGHDIRPPPEAVG